MDANDLLTPEDAAAYLHVTTGLLAQLRYRGTGPAYRKPTPKTVLYVKAELDAWLAASAVKPGA